MKIVLALLALTCATLPLLGGGQKAHKSTVSFHLEGVPGEGPKMVFPQMVAGTERHFRFTPEITTTNVRAFKSFPSDVGDYGVILQLDPLGAKRLAAFSSANQGRWLIAQANGRVVDGVVIDGLVNDGHMVIWKGLSAPEVRALELVLPHIGEDQKTWKKRAKDLKKQIAKDAKRVKKDK